MNALRLTPLIRAWIMTLVAVFLGAQFAERVLGFRITGWLGLVPEAVVLRGYFWQLLTYGFLHADLTHLVLNSLMLAFVGSELEGLWGARRLAQFAVICLLSSGVFYLLLQVVFSEEQGLFTPLVGVSGAIYGMLVAYGILFSERTLLFMMLFPMRAKHFVWVLAAVEFYSSLSSGRSGVSAAAHLGGMAAGVVILWYWARKKRNGGSDPGTRRKKRKKSHLHLVPDDHKDLGPKGPTYH